MEKPILPEEIMKLYEGYEMVDMPESTVLENADEYYKNNGYMTLDTLIERLTKL